MDLRKALDAIRYDAAKTGGSIKAGFDRYAADFADAAANVGEATRLRTPEWVARTRQSANNLRQSADASMGPEPMDQGLAMLTRGVLSAPALYWSARMANVLTPRSHIMRAAPAAYRILKDSRDYIQGKSK
jgi:hypothetical protein